MDKINDEPIITPAHLGEILPSLKEIMANEGEGAQYQCDAWYAVALIEFAINASKRADELQSELDDITRYEGMKLNHNGGGNNG